MEDRSYLDFEEAVLDVKGFSIPPGLYNISFQVKYGQILGLSSANLDLLGTVCGGLAGLIHPEDGQILYQDHDITHLSVAQRVQNGIALVPAWPALFPDLSVRENMLMGGYVRTDRRATAQDIDKLDRWAPSLMPQMDQPARSLAAFDVQLLLIMRALMAKPRLLCVQVPSLALSDQETQSVFATLKSLNRANDLSMILASPLTDDLASTADRVLSL